MGVDISYLDNGQGVLFNCYGESNGEELKDALKRISKNESIEKLKYAFIDETAVTSYKRSLADTQDFVKFHKYIAASVHDDAIVAVVAPSLIGHGLACVWEQQAANIEWHTKVFKTRIEAHDWVKLMMKEYFDTDVNLAK